MVVTIFVDISSVKRKLLLVGSYFKFGLARAGRELGTIYAVVGRCVFKLVNQLFVVCDHKVGDRLSLRTRSPENPAWDVKFAQELFKVLIHGALVHRPFALGNLSVSMTQLEAKIIPGWSLADRALVGARETWELYPKETPVPPTSKVSAPRGFESEDPAEDTLWRMLESLQSVRQRKDIMDRIAKLRRAEYRQSQKTIKTTKSKPKPTALHTRSIIAMSCLWMTRAQMGLTGSMLMQTVLGQTSTHWWLKSWGSQ